MKIICLVALVAAGLVEARPKSQFGGAYPPYPGMMLYKKNNPRLGEQSPRTRNMAGFKL